LYGTGFVLLSDSLVVIGLWYLLVPA